MFGKFAGYAGTIDGIHGLGQRMLAMGYNSPLINIGMSHIYPSLGAVKSHFQEVGDLIKQYGVPKDFGPMVFTITGRGNVGQGAKEIFECFPHEYVKVDQLEDLVRGFKGDSQSEGLHKIYGVKVNAEDYAIRKTDGKYDRNEFRAHPDRYTSNFHRKIAPFTTLLINGIYWDPHSPKLVTRQQLKEIQEMQKANKIDRFRMLGVADISCDMEGSIEFTTHASSIDSPFFYYDAINNVEHKSIGKEGIQVMSIDNLPTELPSEASRYFAELFYPVLKKLVRGEYEDPVIKNGLITGKDGKLMEPHRHLESLLAQYRKEVEESSKTDNTGSGIHVETAPQRKKVLVAGSGLVTGPLIRHLSGYVPGSGNGSGNGAGNVGGIDVLIASNNHEESNTLASTFPNTKTTGLDASNFSQVDELVKGSDLVISMLPAQLHPVVAKAAIKNKKDMVTASYISPAMANLDKEAKKAGVTILNEIGLDPGIDHCSAMKIIDDVKSRGGEIVSFVSWCGGLPAPENSNNPLGYKFSWSPRGVLTAGLNAAKFKLNNKIVQIEGKDLLKCRFPTVPLFSGFALEGLANRDSLSYADVYGLDLERMSTMVRGTLRFQGYSELMSSFVKLGFLDDKPIEGAFTPGNAPVFDYDSDFCKYVLKTENASQKTVTERVARLLERQPADPVVTRVVSTLGKFGMLETSSYDVKVSSSIIAPTALDGFCSILQRNLAYSPNERDMVLLSHEFIAAFPAQASSKGSHVLGGNNHSNPGFGRYELHKSTLASYGGIKIDEITGENKGESAMSRTVGIPVGIASCILLEGLVSTKGVIRPTQREIYIPMLDRLNTLKESPIFFNESCEIMDISHIYTNSITNSLQL
ncbi:Alpha-aminoadipic semialdehyde synthase, mitochondrial [Zancudomyces culisetae]|uniref:Alpha-aminoadipic semialdehyde synthase, mitochondrial n=1 Tax=Zancudomyces culisetae TaxID=1213189 RepID=A0A1R1PWP2_ZANCU|nr:Alpha-aminoadipic semialdehyde synthase, mitochondrial [Zancudomyces culisetae]|eukprot:OMH85312.1 Alpha-aminoadipic semialdehyde synthase, mitochondrial [Zancudomyces culisetae]